MSRIDTLVSMLDGIAWRKYTADLALLVVLLALAPVFMSRVPDEIAQEPPKVVQPQAAQEETIRLVDMAAIEARNVFSPDGKYKEDAQKPPPPPTPPPKNYKLVGILKKDGQRRAVFREGAEQVIVLKTGEALPDDTAVSAITDNSVVLKNYCEERTLRIFEVSVKKP